MGGRSYSPSPPPRGGHGRRGRSPSPRGRYGGGGGGGGGGRGRDRDRDLPTSLLVRNLRHDCRPEDLRRPFGQFGPLKDIYLPRDYYSGLLENLAALKREPRGFGFVQFLDPADAAEAKYQMDGQVLQGRQLTVVFAEENRKKPTDMRTRERRGGRFNDRRRSPPPRYSRSPPPRYSRSPPPRYARSRSNSREYSPPPKRKQHVRSVSPGEKRHSRERSYSRSPPPARGRSPPPRSPVVDNRSPPYNGSRSPSPLPPRERSRSPVRERARAPRDPSRSPVPRDYSPSP